LICGVITLEFCLSTGLNEEKSNTLLWQFMGKSEVILGGQYSFFYASEESDRV